MLAWVSHRMALARLSIVLPCVHYMVSEPSLQDVFPSCSICGLNPFPWPKRGLTSKVLGVVTFVSALSLRAETDEQESFCAPQDATCRSGPLHFF